MEIERHAVALVERDLDHSIFHDCLALLFESLEHWCGKLPSILLSLIALNSLRDARLARIFFTLEDMHKLSLLRRTDRLLVGWLVG